MSKANLLAKTWAQAKANAEEEQAALHWDGQVRSVRGTAAAG